MSNDLPWTPIALWRGQHESIAVSVVAAGGGDACEALDVALAAFMGAIEDQG